MAKTGTPAVSRGGLASTTQLLSRADQRDAMHPVISARYCAFKGALTSASVRKQRETHALDLFRADFHKACAKLQPLHKLQKQRGRKADFKTKYRNVIKSSLLYLFISLLGENISQVQFLLSIYLNLVFDFALGYNAIWLMT